MSTQFNRIQLSQEQTSTIQRKSAEFQEAPGEAEANAVQNAFLSSMGRSPAKVAAALSRADDATVARVVSRLQQERGNQYVQRVVAAARGMPGQLVGRSQPEMVDEVQQRKGSGSPLPEAPRQQMEGFFGADLSGVRVHTGGEAVSLSRELNAQAFTVGSDIFFNEGKYNPHSSDGQGLLAHELTHVGQQTGFDGPLQREEEEQLQREAMAEEEEEVQRQAVTEEEEPMVG